MRALRCATAGAILLASCGSGSAEVGTPGRTVDAGDSPYVINVGPQLPGAPIWQRGFDTLFSDAQDAAVRWALVVVTWSDVQKLPGQIDLSGLDSVVVSAHSHAVNLILQVQTTGDFGLTLPAQALATGGYRTNLVQPLPNPKTAAPMNIDAAIPFWRGLVERYHPHGLLAGEQGWRDSYGITYYEVENEPDVFPWVNGNWQTVTKDYALFLSHVAAAAKGIDPSVRLLAPALSTNGYSSRTGPMPNTGLTWLETLLSTDPAMLSFASDQYRQAGLPSIGAGPYIDVYSFHCDFVDPSSDAHVVQAAGVRELIARFASQPTYPTNPAAPAWCTEGSATITYNPPSPGGNRQRYAWAQVQYATEMLGGGVPRFNYDLGANDTPQDWQLDSVRGATLALTTFFPSGKGVVPITSMLTGLAGQPVFGYQWTNPSTALKSNVMWAKDQTALPSSTPPPPFTLKFSVATPQALIVDPRDWSRSVVNAAHGTVSVTLNQGDPSPPFMVVECSTAGC